MQSFVFNILIDIGQTKANVPQNHHQSVFLLDPFEIDMQTMGANVDLFCCNFLVVFSH
jgi:hypothetical protein